MSWTKPMNLPYDESGDRKQSSHKAYLLDMQDAFERMYFVVRHMVGPTPATDGLVKYSDVQSDSGLVEERTSPNMTVLFNKALGFVNGYPFHVDSALVSSTFIAPSSGNDRIDTISINPDTQAYVVTTGVEDPSPSAPATPTDQLKVAEIYLRDSMTAIRNTDNATDGYITLFQDFYTGTLPPTLDDTWPFRVTIEADDIADYAGIDAYTYLSSTPLAYYRNYAAQGTKASPLIVGTDDTLFQLDSYGYDGATYRRAAAIRIDVDGTPGSNDMPGKILFYVNSGASEDLAAIIESTSKPTFYQRPRSWASDTASFNPGFECYGFGTLSGSIKKGNFNSAMARGTVGSPTIVQDDDIIHRMLGSGFDGSDYQTVAYIDYLIDGTPGAGDVPGRIEFYVSDGASVNLAAMIESNSQPSFFQRLMSVSNSADDYNPGYECHGFGTLSGSVKRGSFNVAIARGTEGSPAIVQDADVIQRMLARAYDGADYQDLAEIKFTVDGTPGAGDMPGRIDFYTTPAGSTSTVVRVSVREDGSLEVHRQGHYYSQATLSTTGSVSWSLLSQPSAKINTLTGNVTLTINDIVINGNGYLYVVQNASSAYTITWPGTVKWAGGTAPDLSTLSSEHFLSFFSYDGTNLVGAFLSEIA